MTDEHRLSFRRTANRLFLTACTAGFGLVFLSLSFAAGADGTDEPSLIQQLVSLPLAAAASWTAIAVARQGIWANAGGVRIRNIFRTYDLRWTDIEWINPPRRYGASRKGGIQFKLRDGRTVSASLYVPGPLNRPDFADDVVQALRDLGH